MKTTDLQYCGPCHCTTKHTKQSYNESTCQRCGTQKRRDSGRRAKP